MRTIARRAKAWTSSQPASSGKKPIHPQYVARVLDQLAAEDAIFTCDVGTSDDLGRAVSHHERQAKDYSAPSHHGSMANALPQAIGAQASYPGRQVISMSGDGGFAMLMGDLLTLAATRIAGEGDRVQERFTGLCRTGDEGGRASWISPPICATRTSQKLRRERDCSD